jgi:hypothetical protein
MVIGLRAIYHLIVCNLYVILDPSHVVRALLSSEANTRRILPTSKGMSDNQVTGLIFVVRHLPAIGEFSLCWITCLCNELATLSQEVQLRFRSVAFCRCNTLCLQDLCVRHAFNRQPSRKKVMRVKWDVPHGDFSYYLKLGIDCSKFLVMIK